MALSQEDKEAFVYFLNSAFKSIPGFLKGMVNPGIILSAIGSIPLQFRKYTLGEIISAIEEAKENKTLNIQ